jgi:hypothetical protein
MVGFPHAVQETAINKRKNNKMTETKTTKKINDSYANACIVYDIQNHDNGNVEVLDGFRAAIKCSRTRAYTYLDPSRVDVDKFGNITKVDAKRVHKFPWCSFFMLEGSPSFEKYRNGMTDEMTIAYYGRSSWEAMEAEHPGCCRQSDEDKQEVAGYWKKREALA